MDVAELRLTIEAEGLPTNLLATERRMWTPPSEQFVVEPRGTGWVTFYAERGLETNLRSFESEAEACQHILDELRSYAAAARPHSD